MGVVGRQSALQRETSSISQTAPEIARSLGTPPGWHARGTDPRGRAVAPGDPRHPTHLRRDRPPQSSRALSSTENSAIAAKVRRAFEERPRWQPALWRPRWRSAQPTSAGGSAFLASKKWRLLRSRILSRATSLRVQEITNNQPVEPRFVSRGITRAKRPRRAPVERREPVRRAVPNPFVVARCDPPCTDPRISSAVL